jgi:hypothetical protein
MPEPLPEKVEVAEQNKPAEAEGQGIIRPH